MSRSGLSALLGAALAVSTGCGSQRELSDSLDQTGSATVVASSSRSSVYAVNVDEGTIAVYEPGTGALKQEVAVGAEPTRIARAGDKVYVTLRSSRSVAVLSETADGLVLDDVVEVGTEPFGIVASEDGSRVFVALSTQGEVAEIDASTMRISRKWQVAGEPRWLALAPNGSALYVGSAYEGRVSWIDLNQDGFVADLEIPDAIDFEENPLTVRVTGDLSISPDGQMLAFPVTYVDNARPVGDPDEVTTDGYGGTTGTSRFTPAVVVADLGVGGHPTVRPLPVSVSGNGGSLGFDTGFATTDGMNLNAGSVAAPYIASVTFSPDSMSIYATLESTSTVAVISTELISGRHPGLGSPGLQPTEFGAAATAFFGTGHGPRGVAFTDETHAFAHAFLDRDLAELRPTWAMSAMGDQFNQGFVQADSRDADASVALTALTRVVPPNVEDGRLLFYSADNSQMSAGGVSCSTCHMDVRNDGLTWIFNDGATHHQTPSLAGPVAVTAPFTWSDGVPSIATEAHITSQGRMGGAGLTYTQEAHISDFVDSTRDVDLPLKGSDDPAIARGRAIFDREDVACASCHSGDRYTDNDFHDLLGEPRTNTPGLVGVAATAPYFHDGRAADLQGVIALTDQALMGDTSMLSDSEKADLITFLKSL
jgi:DNA-binding beta-propeller fold protein YncE